MRAPERKLSILITTLKLAYQGRPGRPAGMLVFDVKLIGIK